MDNKNTMPTEEITEEMRAAGVDETTVLSTREEVVKDLGEDKVKEIENTAVRYDAQSMSPAKAAFIRMMEEYKEQNPTKYALKEAGFIKRLNEMK